MLVIFMVLSRMSPTLEFEYQEFAARQVFASVEDMSESNLTKNGIRGTNQ
jgi:hypothetical protein